MRALATFFLASILCTTVSADIVPTPGSLRVEPVFESADVVCKCLARSREVLEEERLGAEPKSVLHRRVRATVEVLDLYKSDGYKAGFILLEFDEVVGTSGLVTSTRPSVLQGEASLLFLSRSQPGTYRLADPFLGVTTFHSFPQLPSEQPSIAKLQHALVLASEGIQRDDRVRALQLLQGFDHLNSGTLSVAGHLSNSEDPEVAIPALGVLLKTKTAASVEQLEVFLRNYKSDVQPLSFVSLGSELGEISDTDARAILEELSGSRFIAIRYGALDAIRRIRSPKSVPILVRRLDDPDTNIEYVALISLAEILGKYDGDFAPSMYIFDRAPQRYLALWKQWWAEEGSKLYSTQPTS